MDAQSSEAFLIHTLQPALSSSRPTTKIRLGETQPFPNLCISNTKLAKGGDAFQSTVSIATKTIPQEPICSIHICVVILILVILVGGGTSTSGRLRLSVRTCTLLYHTHREDIRPFRGLTRCSGVAPYTRVSLKQLGRRDPLEASGGGFCAHSEALSPGEAEGL